MPKYSPICCNITLTFNILLLHCKSNFNYCLNLGFFLPNISRLAVHPSKSSTWSEKPHLDRELPELRLHPRVVGGMGRPPEWHLWMGPSRREADAQQHERVGLLWQHRRCCAVSGNNDNINNWFLYSPFPIKRTNYAKFVCRPLWMDLCQNL